MSEKETRSKRQIIIDTINEGGATIESLAKAADCKYASVMSNFSMLRLMGMYPVKDVVIMVDGPEDTEVEVLTYRFVDAEEKASLDALAAEKSTTKAIPAKSPAERLDAAEKRIVRCKKADEAAKARLAKDEDSVILGLRAQLAAIQLEIAEHEHAEAKAACPVEEDGVVEDSGPEEVPESEDDSEGNF